MGDLVTPAAVIEWRPAEGPAAWHRARSRGIGGSDASAVLGRNPYRSAYEVWVEKVAAAAAAESDTPSQPEEPPSEAAYFGHRLEPVVLDELARRANVRVEAGPGLLVNVHRQWQRCTLDGLVYDEELRPVALVEAKTVGFPESAKWSIEDGIAVEMPFHALIQVHHSLAVTGLSLAYVAVLVSGQRFGWAAVHADHELATLLTTIEREFWQLVIDRRPPRPDGSKSAGEAIRRRHPAAQEGKAVDVDGELYELTMRAAELGQQVKELSVQRETLIQRVQDAMGDAETAMFAGRKVATWKTYPATARVDAKRLAAEDPHTYAQYAVSGEPYRRFVISGGR